MEANNAQPILSFVEKPSRYLGTEINAIRKDGSSVKLAVALAFPDLYEIGTSHFGIQILYHIINQRPDMVAERVFAPAMDMQAMLRKTGAPLTSLESGKPLAFFDLIGFSLLYELNYTNVLSMLRLAGIPFRAVDRGPNAPLVIAGGPCTVNPEPMAVFFDAMVIGDGEQVILKMAEAVVRWKQAGRRGKEALWDRWEQIQGVYLPGRLSPSTRIRRAVIPDLETAPFPTRPVVPFGRPVHDRLRIELARGCTRGCRFCQAGIIYRPVRERSAPTVMKQIQEALNATGYEDLSLLSLSTGDYSCLAGLLGAMIESLGRQRVAISLPSLRASALTPGLMGFIQTVRKTGFTIAPEAGSQRLRDIINKNIDQRQIESAVGEAVRMGWKVIKLYFMIGLPFETDSDVSAIAALVETLRRIGRRRIQLNVSVATFIPKPHTPFQWVGQMEMDTAKAYLTGLQRQLQYRDVQFKWQNPRVSLLEGLFARGDRPLANLLEAAFSQGCGFDGWTDLFHWDRWQKAMDATGIDPCHYTRAPRSLDAILPWDHIDVGVTKAFLIQEWLRAQNGQVTPDCRSNGCQDCGVCDFKDVMPKMAPPADVLTAAPATASTTGTVQQVTITFAKTGNAKYFSHLETMKIFERALRRAGVGLVFSKGFHPKPQMVFADALPVGMQSRQESLRVAMVSALALEQLPPRLNDLLPDGFQVHECRRAAPEKAGGQVISYTIKVADGIFDESALKSFWEKPSCLIQKRSGNKIDLRAAVVHWGLDDPCCLAVSLRPVEGMLLRPAEILKWILGWSEERIRSADIVKEGCICHV
jgi:radical SAM family uncharacterized protein/radical SAM-linked protein